MDNEDKEKNIPKKGKGIFLKIIRIAAFLLVCISLFFVAQIKMQPSKSVGKNVKTSANEGININKLICEDKSFKEEHCAGAYSCNGFASPYGYYYFDKRILPDKSSVLRKSGLILYDYNTHKSEDIVVRTKDKKLVDLFVGGTFFREKLYLIEQHGGIPDDGYDIYCGNPDGSEMVKIYSSSAFTRGDTVVFENYLFITEIDSPKDSSVNSKNKMNEARIVKIDLHTLTKKTIFSRRGYDAVFTLCGYYDRQIYFSYSDKRYSEDQNRSGNYNEEDSREASLNCMDIYQTSPRIVNANIFPADMVFEGKYLVMRNSGNSEISLTVQDLENYHKTQVTLYKDVSSENGVKGNTYSVFDGKIFYYTKANKQTDDMNCYDLNTKKIKKFTPATISDPTGEVNLRIHQSTADGYIFDKYVLSKKEHQTSSTLTYISKEDYYAGKSVFFDFDY